MGNSVVGLAGDQVLAIAQADAARVYRDLSLYRIQLVLEDDGWHVDYELKNPRLKGGGPHYIIDAYSPVKLSHGCFRRAGWGYSGNNRGAAVFNPFTEVIDESTDFDLIFQAKNGNRDAFRKTGPPTSGMDFRNIAPCGWFFYPQDAEEVTQEVLIKAITRLQHFSRRQSVPHLALPHYGQPRAEHEAARRGDAAA